MEQQQFKQSNRKTMLGFLAIFTLPIIASWSAYFGGWFDGIGTTNKGELISPVISLETYNPVYANQEDYLMKPGEKWKLIILQDVNQCQDDEKDLYCLVNLFLINQTHTALGKDIERVEIVLLNLNESYSDQQLAELQKRFIGLRVVVASTSNSELLPSHIYIADPLGNIMLRYAAVSKKEDVPLKGKDILKDMKKLLKLSRID